MSEQQCAFDNWQDAAQQVSKQPQKIQQKQVTKTDIDIQKQLTQTKPQQIKQTLKQKIQQYKQLTPQQFQNKYINNGQDSKKVVKLGVGKVLKTDKDFNLFAKEIADKLCDGLGPQDTLDQQSIVTFIEQLSLYIYGGLEWVNYFEIIKKMKAIKNARKEDQKKIQKQKQKKQKQNKNDQKQQIVSSSKIAQKQKYDKAPKDDLFGGATMINSKQQQQQRKKKLAQSKVENKMEQKVQVQKKPTPPPADDDDDFM